MKFFVVLIFSLLLPRCVHAGTITLVWDANAPSDHVAYYTLSYHELGQSTVHQTGVTTPTVTISLPNNNVWYASVTATDTSGHTSQPSSEVTIRQLKLTPTGKL